MTRHSLGQPLLARSGHHVVGTLLFACAVALGLLLWRPAVRAGEGPAFASRGGPVAGSDAVELAKDWRTDRYLRRLEAMMAVADRNSSLVMSGTGDVLEPEDSLIGIGSGGAFALAAARALSSFDLSAEEIARRAMKIAAGICVFTNENITLESLTTG